MKVTDYWQMLRARRWSIVAIMLLLGLAVGLSSLFATPRYQASASLYFSLPTSSSAADLNQGSTFTQSQVLSYAELATKPIVLSRTIDDLQLDTTPRRLAESITATASSDTVIVDVRARSTSAELAAELANSVSAELSDVVTDLAPRDTAGRPTIDATVVQEATTPSVPFAPQTVRNVLIALVAGLLLGVAYAVCRELLNTRPRSAAEVASITGAPILTEEAHRRRAPKSGVPATTSRELEPYRRLRTNLRYVRAERDIDVVTVTSSLAGEGKTTAAIDFALVCAAAGDRVLLIDADLRKPTIATRLGLESGIGLTNVLADRASLEDLLQQTRGHDGLDVLTSGEVPPNPSQLVDSSAMGVLIDKARSTYDIVIIDSPPLVPVSDAAVLARRSTGAVLVANLRKVHRSHLHHSTESLEQVGAKVIGLVVRGTEAQSGSAYYGAAVTTRQGRSARRRRRRRGARA